MLLSLLSKGGNKIVHGLKRKVKKMKQNEIIKIENYAKNKIEFIEWELKMLKNSIEKNNSYEMLERCILLTLVNISRLEGLLECFQTKLKYAPSKEWVGVWDYIAVRYSKVKSMFKEVVNTWADCPERLKYLINRNL